MNTLVLVPAVLFMAIGCSTPETAPTCDWSFGFDLDPCDYPPGVYDIPIQDTPSQLRCMHRIHSFENLDLIEDTSMSFGGPCLASVIVHGDARIAGTLYGGATTNLCGGGNGQPGMSDPSGAGGGGGATNRIPIPGGDGGASQAMGGLGGDFGDAFAGCDGGWGGGIDETGTGGGMGGKPGGGVRLYVRGTLEVTGSINASGDPGEPGTLPGAGGGGGGSGGQLSIMAGAVIVSGAICANGGAGGGGANATEPVTATAGERGPCALAAAVGGAGGGGRGGAGGFGTTPPENGESVMSGGGGGGGGTQGSIHIHSAEPPVLTGPISPPPTLN